MKKVVLAFIAACAVAPPLSAQPPVPIPDRAKGAETIVVATVLQVTADFQRNAFGDQLIVSHALLEVEESIKGAGATTVLYMTWARKNAPQTQQVITDAYMSIGRELKAIVVPVGVVWQRVLRKHGEPVLHDQDQSHPTLAGSYLAACVFLRVLFNENPLGIDVDVEGLAPKHRALLQKSAGQGGTLMKNLRPVRSIKRRPQDRAD